MATSETNHASFGKSRGGGHGSEESAPRLVGSTEGRRPLPLPVLPCIRMVLYPPGLQLPE